ncbi:hypothetical protein GCM10010279_32860 [Streptomyces mutabilis]|nr:hypothetical protein GCM10010279_32860 [Streptomyces mutabilis]
MPNRIGRQLRVSLHLGTGRILRANVHDADTSCGSTRLVKKQCSDPALFDCSAQALLRAGAGSDLGRSTLQGRKINSMSSAPINAQAPSPSTHISSVSAPMSPFQPQVEA